MYDSSKLVEFKSIRTSSCGLDCDGCVARQWRLDPACFSDIAGPEGRVYSFVAGRSSPISRAIPVGQKCERWQRRPGRENVEVVSADLVALPESSQSLDVCVATPVLPRSPIPPSSKREAQLRAGFNRAVYERAQAGWVLRHSFDHVAPLGRA